MYKKTVLQETSRAVKKKSAKKKTTTTGHSKFTKVLAVTAYPVPVLDSLTQGRTVFHIALKKRT